MQLTILAYTPGEMVIYQTDDGITWYCDLDGSCPLQVEEVYRVSYLQYSNKPDEEIWDMCKDDYNIATLDIDNMWWRFFRII